MLSEVNRDNNVSRVHAPYVPTTPLRIGGPPDAIQANRTNHVGSNSLAQTATIAGSPHPRLHGGQNSPREAVIASGAKTAEVAANTPHLKIIAKFQEGYESTLHPDKIKEFETVSLGLEVAKQNLFAAQGMIRNPLSNIDRLQKEIAADILALEKLKTQDPSAAATLEQKIADKREQLDVWQKYIVGIRRYKDPADGIIKEKDSPRGNLVKKLQDAEANHNQALQSLEKFEASLATDEKKSIAVPFKKQQKSSQDFGTTVRNTTAGGVNIFDTEAIKLKMPVELRSQIETIKSPSQPAAQPQASPAGVSSDPSKKSADRARQPGEKPAEAPVSDKIIPFPTGGPSVAPTRGTAPPSEKIVSRETPVASSATVERPSETIQPAATPVAQPLGQPTGPSERVSAPREEPVASQQVKKEALTRDAQTIRETPDKPVEAAREGSTPTAQTAAPVSTRVQEAPRLFTAQHQEIVNLREEIKTLEAEKENIKQAAPKESTQATSRAAQTASSPAQALPISPPNPRLQFVEEKLLQLKANLQEKEHALGEPPPVPPKPIRTEQGGSPVPPELERSEPREEIRETEKREGENAQKRAAEMAAAQRQAQAMPGERAKQGFIQAAAAAANLGEPEPLRKEPEKMPEPVTSSQGSGSGGGQQQGGSGGSADQQQRQRQAEAARTGETAGAKKPGAKTIGETGFTGTIESHEGESVAVLSKKVGEKEVFVTLTFDGPKNEEDLEKYLKMAANKAKIDAMVKDYLILEGLGKKDAVIRTASDGSTEFQYKTAGKSGVSRTKTIGLGDLQKVGPERGKELIAKMATWEGKLQETGRASATDATRARAVHLTEKKAKMTRVLQAYGLIAGGPQAGPSLTIGAKPPPLRLRPQKPLPAPPPRAQTTSTPPPPPTEPLTATPRTAAAESTLQQNAEQLEQEFRRRANKPSELERERNLETFLEKQFSDKTLSPSEREQIKAQLKIAYYSHLLPDSRSERDAHFHDHATIDPHNRVDILQTKLFFMRCYVQDRISLNAVLLKSETTLSPEQGEAFKTWKNSGPGSKIFEYIRSGIGYQTSLSEKDQDDFIRCNQESGTVDELTKNLRKFFDEHKVDDFTKNLLLEKATSCFIEELRDWKNRS